MRNRKLETVILRCKCQCCMLVVDKEIFDDGEINYNLSVQDSYYYHNFSTLWGRIKCACKALFGKPIYYNDVYLEDPAEFRGFVKELNGLVVEEAGERENGGGADA